MDTVSVESLTTPANRKSLYNFNQAIKSVYTGYRYSSGIVTPLDMNGIKSMPLFKYSLFTWRGPNYECIHDSAISIDEMNNALKTAGKYSMKDVDGTHVLHIVKKSGEEFDFNVSVPMTRFQVEDIQNYPGLKKFKRTMDREAIVTYTLSQDDIDALLAYESLEKVIGEYNGKDIRIIVAKELFPVIKKVDSICIRVYEPIDLPEGVFDIMVASNSEDWSFYSMHNILC